MPYEALATSKTPALIVYVLDVSASMTQILGNRRRIDVVMDAFAAALRQMIFRSTKGRMVAPRYRIAILAYSDQIFDLLDGVKTVDQVARLGVPELSPMRSTETARAFLYLEKLLARELPFMSECPAPLVCHMTDGEYTGADPEPIVQRIKDMSVFDGKVLLENIFISERILLEHIPDPHQWSGVLPTTRLANDYARKLRSISSPLPESYRVMMEDSGYAIHQGALMMLPGVSSELVEMGFVMSTATPVSRR